MSGPLVVIMRPGHPLAGKLDLPAYLAAQHVLVSSRREGPGMEDFGLSRLGYRRNIRLRCQHHMAALSTVMGSAATWSRSPRTFPAWSCTSTGTGIKARTRATPGCGKG